MKILAILSDEKMENDKKLAAVGKFVGTVRKQYGNADADITAKKVATSDGLIPISLLSPAEKVAVATAEVKQIIQMATAGTENVEGAVFDRVLEALVAVNGILCNLDQETDSAY